MSLEMNLVTILGFDIDAKLNCVTAMPVEKFVTATSVLSENRYGF